MENSPQETPQSIENSEPTEVSYTIPVDDENADNSWQDHEWFTDIEQDTAVDKSPNYASYQPGESMYEAYVYKKALRENTLKQIGAYTLFIPGIPQAVGLYKDASFDLKYRQKTRKSYIREHGTIVSNTRDHYRKVASRISKLRTERSNIS